ncbi:hypothetical protein [Amycolatopsis vastitatis]|uniref:Uncharacterized protein n=1 Tax=Amycolatopsis vastitatis TaxID=1905142 RepID=A0A229SR17_9PSEU|nr:hypothetical protein [Amycolatopsis vastitatis]OXM61298.1 hypothetical protein CF165_38990 [Amycolatopsis vastitatis]
MNGRTEDQPEEHAGAATSVAGLGRTPEWTVSGSRGRWTTAERTLHAGGRRWVIGLTPTAGGETALMLWRGDEVVAHRRGTEAALCGTALRWVGNLLAGRPFDG